MLLLFIPILYSIKIIAQERIVTYNLERNSDGTMSINADSKAFSNYTIKLTLLDITGYSSNVQTESVKTIRPGGVTQLARLTPDKSSTQRGQSYRTQSFPGTSFNKPPDTSFVYLMPSTANNTLRTQCISATLKKMTIQ